MSFPTFSPEDFDVMAIPGLEPRMQEIKRLIRPKLESIGTLLAPALSDMTEQMMSVHVAKHARRTVNPPDSTWVAWAAHRRGYKAHPHFQLGLWQTHLFLWFALFPEAEAVKPVFGKMLLERLEQIRELIPAHFVWSTDHTRPEAIPHAQMTDSRLAEMGERLQTIKKSELLCGLHLMRNDPVLHDGTALQKKVVDTFATLAELYRLLMPAP